MPSFILKNIIRTVIFKNLSYTYNAHIFVLWACQSQSIEMLNGKNAFFNHVWTEPSLPVYNQYFFFFFFFFFGGGGGYVLLKDTTRRLEWGSNPRLLNPESEVLTTRPPRPHQARRTRYDTFINVAKHSEMCWIPLSAGHDFGCRSGLCRFH